MRTHWKKGSTPFDTIVDTPFTTISGGQPYSPRIMTKNLKDYHAFGAHWPLAKRSGVKLAEKVGYQHGRRYGETGSGLRLRFRPICRWPLGAADMKLVDRSRRSRCSRTTESRIDPHMIFRRVTSYDGALLEEASGVHEFFLPT